MSQQIHAGASGYSFKEWKGAFYPAKLAAADMLAKARVAMAEIADWSLAREK